MNYADRERAQELLKQKWVELGRRPSYDDIKGDPEMPDPNYYSTQWGSLDKALDSIRGMNSTATLKVNWNNRPKDLKETAPKKAFGQDRSYKVYSEDEAIQIVLKHAKPSYEGDESVMGFLPTMKSIQKDHSVDAKGVIEALGGNWRALERRVIEHEKALGKIYLRDDQKNDYLNSRKEEVFSITGYREKGILHIQMSALGMKKPLELTFQLK